MSKIRNGGSNPRMMYGKGGGYNPYPGNQIENVSVCVNCVHTGNPNACRACEMYRRAHFGN